MDFTDNEEYDKYQNENYLEINEEYDDFIDELPLIDKPEPVMASVDSLDYEDETNILMVQDDNNPNKRSAFTLDDNLDTNESVKIRRRSGKVERNKQGPVMSTKRKRLDGKLDIPGQKIVTKKRAVKPKQRKVRRVKSEDDEW